MSKTIELEATELFNPKVMRVSLVNRGANRSPIRTLKSEDSMKKTLDLSNLQGLLTQKAAEAPTSGNIVAAITSLKGDACKELTDSLAEDGIVVAKSFETEVGTTLIFDDSADLSDVSQYNTVEVSPEVAVVMKGFSPWSTAEDANTPFAEAMKATGYFSNVYKATELLRDRMEEVAYTAASKASFEQSVLPLVDEFSAYIRSMASSLPDVAFKMATKAAELSPEEEDDEEVVAEPAKVVVTDVVEPTPEEVENPTVGDTDGEAQAPKETEEPVVESEPSVVVEDTAAQEPVDATPATTADTTAVAKADDKEVDGIALILESLKVMKAEQATTFAELEKRLDKTEAKVEKASSRTVGAVASAPPSTPEVQKVVEKDASLSRPIDTGYRSINK